MVVFPDSVDAGMHTGTARHGAGNFFAQEEVGIAAQFFDRVDRVMVGYSDEVHAALFQFFMTTVIDEAELKKYEAVAVPAE